jgi:hypothetical protein
MTKVLWVFAIALLLNALPNNSLISNATAELGYGDTLNVNLSDNGLSVTLGGIVHVMQ